MSSDESIPQEQASEDQRTQHTDEWTFVPEEVKVDARRAAIGGVLAAVVALAGAWMVGQASGAEARMLLETSLPSTRSFCGTVTLASSTILALMLTLLSLSASTETDLKWSHYQRIRQIARIDSVVLVAAILVYLLLNVPLGESDTAAGTETPWFAILYYASLVLSSLLAGALIAIVLMLFNTVRDIIQAVGPKPSSRLARSEEDESS